MKPRWDGMLAGRDEAGRSFKAFLGLSARTGPVFKRGQVVMQEREAEVFDPRSRRRSPTFARPAIRTAATSTLGTAIMRSSAKRTRRREHRSLGRV